MRCAFWSEFLFVGAVILPPFLLLAGQPALAILAFVFLLLAGALCSIGDPDAPHRKPPPHS